MAEPFMRESGKVVYLRPPGRGAATARRFAANCAYGLRVGLGVAGWLVGRMLTCALWLLRLAVCTLLVLTEPLLRVTLVPLAFLSFIVTLIFGFLIGDPRFPKCGMLAFSFGALWIYWLFLGLMALFMRMPRDHD